MTTDVRRGTRADLDALIAFDQVARTSSQRRELIRQGLRNSEVSVADVDGAPQGYTLVHHRFFGHAFIELVYVCMNNRRRGIGSALIQHAIQNAEGPKLFTSTNRSNATMRRLLARLGFEESGIIHNLDPGDPELVYCKRLSSEQDAASTRKTYRND